MNTDQSILTCVALLVGGFTMEQISLNIAPAVAETRTSPTVSGNGGKNYLKCDTPGSLSMYTDWTLESTVKSELFTLVDVRLAYTNDDTDFFQYRINSPTAIVRDQGVTYFTQPGTGTAQFTGSAQTYSYNKSVIPNSVGCKVAW
jgi:hypothetical protein